MQTHSTEPISDIVLSSTITRALQSVVRTMLGRSALFLTESEPRRHLGKSIRVSGDQVVGTVGFVGDINGLIYLYISKDLANLAAAHLLGIHRNEVNAESDERVNDAVGELTNMTVGAFKNELCDRGLSCKLTIPSILRGCNFTIEPISSATHRVYQFQVGDHQIVAYLLLSRDE